MLWSYFEFFNIYVLYIICVLLTLHQIIWKRFCTRCFVDKVPIAYGLPFVGIGYNLVPNRKIFHAFEWYSQRLKSATYCAWLGTNPVLVTMDPELIKDVMSSEYLLNKARFMYKPINNAIHNGIITSQVNKWKQNRKLMNSTLANKILINFIPIFNKGAEKTINKFKVLVGTEEHEVFDILKRIILQISCGKFAYSTITPLFVYDVIIETTIGIVLQDGMEDDEKLVQGFNFITEQIMKDTTYSSVGLSFLARTPKYFRTLKCIWNTIDKLMKEKRNRRETVINDSKDADTIKKTNDIFLNKAIHFHDRALFSVDDVINETHTMVVGAFETTSTTLYSTLLMLAMHPQTQERLYEEIYAMFPNKDFEVQLEDIQVTPYLNMVIDEVLRLMPSIPIIGRQAIRSTQLTGDITLPKDMQVMISIFNLHRRKEIWGPNANAFDPDNFLPENSSRRHPYAYIPFSKGQRNCIGWRYAYISLRILLLRLVRNYKFSTSFKFDDLVFLNHISLAYEIEPKLKIEKRP